MIYCIESIQFLIDSQFDCIINTRPKIKKGKPSEKDLPLLKKRYHSIF
jgi:hypothetical protein